MTFIHFSVIKFYLLNFSGPQSSAIKKASSATPSQGAQCEVLLQDLHKQLAHVMATNPASKMCPNEDELKVKSRNISQIF